MVGNGCEVDVYRWTHVNDYFMWGSMDGDQIGMGGGGDGSFGFLLYDDLNCGTTGRCETFGNPPLVVGPADTGGDKPVTFKVANIEVWAFSSEMDFLSGSRRRLRGLLSRKR
jgi:hypothetical protein